MKITKWDYQNNYCYFCHTEYDLHEHHIFEGTANRKISEKYKMKIKLCGKHHNLSDEGVHFDKAKDIELKQLAQREFEKRFSHEEFMKVIGRNYI